MSAAEAGASVVRRLLAEIRVDRKALAARNAEVQRYGVHGKALTPERAAALALALDRAYTALESILERVARTLEGGMPEGGDWHRALLHNAALDIPSVRAPVLSTPAVDAADQLRRFRHFLRHAYAADLDAARLQRLATLWSGALSDVDADLDQFGHFLEQLAARLEAAGRARS